MESDPGTERGQNEDACGSHVESATHVLVAVADGVSGEAGGEFASTSAIEVTLRAYRESPVSWGPAKRLYRAAQQANIEIYDRALVVTELRGMSTTLTAIVVDGDTLYAAHVGDSRLYLIRNGEVVQKTKDHTVTGERRRMGLLSAKSAKRHPKRSVLTRSLGRELIVAVDRIAFPILGGDILVLCSDGLYNVLDEGQLLAEVAGRDPAGACASLVQRSNARGTPDNLTVAVVQIPGELPVGHSVGWRSRLARLIGA
jgi:PPM family protein phosphatase